MSKDNRTNGLNRKEVNYYTEVEEVIVIDETAGITQIPERTFEDSKAELKWLIDTQMTPIISENVDDFMVCEENRVKFREHVQAYNIFAEGLEVLICIKKV